MANECPKCQTNNPDTVKFCGECGTSLEDDVVLTKTLETPSEELKRGSVFAGRYEIIEEIGKGGMGHVYRVEDTKAKEEVALKLIRPVIATDKKTIERFRNELTTARKITHKNVCRMYDLGEERGRNYITMEYVSGQDVKGIIHQMGQLTVGKAVSIAKQICDGLAEAHNLGVVHRDIKPNNIMIDRGGNAKIMDFGIARAVKGKSITGSGVAIGTPQYMSPEQVEGKEVDLRSDIYSLGILLYEMLTDKVPFEGDTPLTIGVKQKTEVPKDPKEYNERISEDLSRVILRCMAKDRENRYQNANELRADLDKLEQGLPTTDRVIPKKKNLTSREISVQFNMKKIFIPTFAIFAFSIIALIIWSPWTKKSPVLIQSDKPTLAIVYFENNTGDENLDRWSSSFTGLLITDLSQSKILNVLSDDRLYTVLQRLNLLDAKVYSSEDLKNIAALAGVQYILGGKMDKAGDTVIVSTRLHNMDSGEQPKTRRIDTQGEQDFTNAVDQLTPLIKADLNLGSREIANDNDEEVGKITTNSPEAYRSYHEGREQHRKGNPKQSIPFMEKAISIDPNFAMAYRSLGVSYSNLGNQDKVDQYYQKAFDLSDKVSEQERLFIHADYYNFSKGNKQKAAELYHQLLELAPDHHIGRSNLAGIYHTLQEWDKAIEQYELDRELGGEFLGTYRYLGVSYEAKGMYQKAREVYNDYLNNIDNDARIHVWIADSYAFEGKYDLALKEADKAISLDPTRSYTKSRIYHLMDNFEAAETGYKSWLDWDGADTKMNGREWLEFLYRMLGQYEKAKKELQTGLEYAQDNNLNHWEIDFNSSLASYEFAEGNLDGVLARAEFIWDNALKNEAPTWQVGALSWKIKVYLKQDNIEEARVLAEEVKKICESLPSKNEIRWYLDDLGLIEMKRENYSEAIELFTQAYEMQGGQRSWYDPHAYILNNLASAYYLNGDLVSAKKEYEKILALTTGRLWWGDLYVKSYYHLGKIYEEQGNSEKAIEQYEKFLSLWKDADPGLPEVDNAKKRLAGLKSQ